MGISRSLLEDLLHLPIGVNITDAVWSQGHDSVILTVEGMEIPVDDGKMLTPIVTHVDDYLWDWCIPPRRES